MDRQGQAIPADSPQDWSNIAEITIRIMRGESLIQFGPCSPFGSQPINGVAEALQEAKDRALDDGDVEAACRIRDLCDWYIKRKAPCNFA